MMMMMMMIIVIIIVIVIVVVVVVLLVCVCVSVIPVSGSDDRDMHMCLCQNTECQWQPGGCCASVRMSVSMKNWYLFRLKQTKISYSKICCLGFDPLLKYFGFGVISVLVCFSDHLVGLMVKVSALRVEDPRFESRLHQDFFWVESYQ